ncbi:MAG: hypothetical protein SFU83_12960, partial [Meiothermus sp.]|nr:hypothetical protein [Meiothermus sp.]
MNPNITLKALEQSALDAHARLEPTNRDLLLDRYFVRQHLVPVLLFRMQAHIPMSPAEMAQLWAEHLGLSESLQAAWLPKLEATFARFAALLKDELQQKNPRIRLQTVLPST